MRRFTLPPIGMRLIKTTAAVFITLVLTHLRPGGLPIYGVLSAVLCMQSSSTDSLRIGLNRIVDTLVGAGFGLLTLLVMQPFEVFSFWLWRYLLIGLVTVLVIYITVLLKRPSSSYFTWVVFLSIVLLQGTQDPTLYALNRAVDTLIGIAVSYLINGFWWRRRRNTGVLFVAGFDHVLAQDDATLSNYTLANLNRLLEREAAVTLASHRTPATLLPRIEGVAFALPIIIMDGAAIYHIGERSFPFYVRIPPAVVEGIVQGCDADEVQCYQYAILHDELHVFCAQPGNAYEQALDERLQLRRYHSYVQEPPPGTADVLFLFYTGTHAQIDAVEQRLRALPYHEEVTIVRHDDGEHPGYANIEVSSIRASKDKAARWIMEHYGHTKLAAFGHGPSDRALLEMADYGYCMEGSAPVVAALGLPVAGSNAHNAVVRKIRKLFYNRKVYRAGGGKPDKAEEPGEEEKNQ